MITMYFKIASGNIKKCYKDYTIYFLTLILAVCIFYSFNSIDSQKALWDIKSSNAKYIEKINGYYILLFNICISNIS